MWVSSAPRPLSLGPAPAATCLFFNKPAQTSPDTLRFANSLAGGGRFGCDMKSAPKASICLPIMQQSSLLLMVFPRQG